MTDKRQQRREDMRTRFVEAAAALIVWNGVQGLRARDVAAEVGSALGSLYNAFADLDDLVIHVNSATLARLKRSIEDRTAGCAEAHETLQALALAYLAFARENRKLWSALFEHRFASGRPIPDWHRAEQADLMDALVRPLRRLLPTFDEAALLVRARTVFAAVHGIVSISLEDRFIGIGTADLDKEMLRFVDILTTGLKRCEA